MRTWLVLTLALAWIPMGNAQSPDGPPAAQRHATEWGFTTGGATDLPGGAQGGQFWALQLRWGKVLTGPHGPGPLRGTLEYAFEIVPAMILRQACSNAILVVPYVASNVAPPECTITRATPFLTGSAAASTLPSRGGTLFGGGINPIFWQYNFTSHRRVVPYFNLGAGMLFTTRDFPAGTSSFNFTPQGGIGISWFAWPGRAVNFGIRYHHISNAGITKPNPGHNALYFYTGFSWWK